MSNRLSSCLTLALAVVILPAGPARTETATGREDGRKSVRKVEFGAQVQIQYANVEETDSDSTDRIFFRRLRPHLSGSVTEDWQGKIAFDLGKAVDGDEVTVKDAYMRYTGWKNLQLTIGNSKTPFSREFLASSKRQQSLERGFVGDHNFGSPDRQLGVKLEGRDDGKKLAWAVALGGQHHDPDARKIDFDTPANRKSDWNEGVVVAARVDFHPRGHVGFGQGDFRTSGYKYNFSLAAYGWSNDGDNNPYTDPVTGAGVSSGKAELDRADGLELSAGVRGEGLSVDAEYQVISADTVDPAFTGGVYLDGSTDLDKAQIEGGYMLRGNRVEIVAAWESLDADNYETSWEATEIGINYFWDRHQVKVQLNYRMAENVFGVRGDDADTLLLQWQLLF